MSSMNVFKEQYANKQDVWHNVRFGRLMNLTIDTETGGKGRGNVPYATPNYPVLFEYGDVLTDLSGNYLNHAQFHMNRPFDQAFEAGAPILQRLITDPRMYDDEKRLNHIIGKAMALERMERAAYSYGELAEMMGREAKTVSFKDYSHAFVEGTDNAHKDSLGLYKPLSDQVYEMPLYDTDLGRVVNDVRYHKNSGKVSYRFDPDPRIQGGQFFEGLGKQFYYDTDSESYWRVVDAAPNFLFFNAEYDWNILLGNLMGAGMPLKDTRMFNNQTMPLFKQLGKGAVLDVMHMMNMASMFGGKGDNGIDFPSFIDPDTGKPSYKLTLSAYAQAHTRQGSEIRMHRSGLFLPDGAKHDPQLDHGAMIDAMATEGLTELMRQRAPWVMRTYAPQRDNRTLHHFLGRGKAKDDELPVIGLPEREAGGPPKAGLYYFIGTDADQGNMKRLIFVKCDSDIKGLEHHGKKLHEMSVDDLDEMMESPAYRSRSDKPIRIESENKYPGGVKLKDILKMGARVDLVHGKEDRIIQNCAYIAENEQMRENIKAVVGRQNYRMSRGNKLPLYTNKFDEFLKQGGGVPYPVTKKLIDEVLQDGAQKLPPVIDTLYKMLNERYSKKMLAVNDELKFLAVQPMPFDFYKDKENGASIHLEVDEDGEATPRALEARRHLNDFKERVDKAQSAKFKKKQWPYKAIIEGIKNPDTAAPYIQQGKLKIRNMHDAFEFRCAIGKRMMEDWASEVRKKNSLYAQGYVMEDYANPPPELRHRHLLLPPDADNGNAGGIPQFVDETGRAIDYEYLYAQKPEDVEAKINSGAWKARFSRLPSEPTMVMLAQRFVGLGMEKDIPKEVMDLYLNDYILTMGGYPGETVDTSRIPTLCTLRHELNHNKEIQSRAAETEEGQKILANLRRIVDKYIAELEETKLKQAQKFGPMVDTRTGEALLDIKHEIPRDSRVKLEEDPNFLTLDVPLEQALKPVEQMDIKYPHRGIILPNVDTRAQWKINLNARNKVGAATVLRTPYGPLFATGPAGIQEIKADDPALRTVLEKMRNDYAAAGLPIKETDKLYYLGIEHSYPLAATRDLDFSLQSIDLPEYHFWGTMAPEFARAARADERLAASFDKASRGEGYKAVIIPADYVPQSLSIDEKLRLRQVEGRMFANLKADLGKPSGHIVETNLRNVWGLDQDGGEKGIMLDELLEDIRSGRIPERVVQDAGFLDGDHLERRLKEDFVTEKWRANPGQQRFLILQWDAVNEAYIKGGRNEKDNKWAYIQPDPGNDNTRPRAAMLRYKRPAQPSDWKP